MEDFSLVGAVEGVDGLIHSQHIKNELIWFPPQQISRSLQPLFLVGLLVLERHPHGFLLAVVEDHEVLHDARHGFLWNRQRYSCERVKGDRLPLTVWANHFGFILSSQKIHNNGLVSLGVGEPAFFSNFLILAPFTLHGFHIGLLLDSVEILVEAISQEGEKLLGVMLSVA